MHFVRGDDSRGWAAFLVIFSTALVVRLIFYWQLSDTLFGRNAFLDASYYDTWAQSIASGDWLGGTTPFFVEPGYLYLLAFAKWLGADISSIRFVQAVIGAGTALLAAALAQRIGGAKAALCSGLAVACYAPLVHFEGQLLKTTLEVFFSTLVLVLALSRRPHPLALGLGAGVALMLKSNFALMLPLLVLWSAWRERANPTGRWRAPVLVMLGVAPLLLLTAARNHTVSGEALILPWSSGINFYIGNGPEANGRDPTLPFASVGPRGEGLAGKREAERRIGHRLSHAESSSFWWTETRRHILQQPLVWAGLLVDKARLFFHYYEFTDNVSLYFVRQRVPILRWLPMAYWLVVPLALAGVLGAALTRDPARGLLAAFLLVQTAGVIGFHIVERYRMAIVPCAIALGVVALSEFPKRTKRERIGLAGAVVAGLFLSLGLPPPTGPPGQNMAGHHRFIAVDAMRRGDYVEAEREYSNASQLNPLVPKYHFRLSLARRMLGDEVGAERAAIAGYRLEPERGRLQLGVILTQLRPALAAQVCLQSAELGHVRIESLHCAAAALLRAGEPDEAEQVLMRAIEIAPNVVDLWITLGDVRLERGERSAARSAWQQALRLSPRPSHELEERLDREPDEG